MDNTFDVPPVSKNPPAYWLTRFMILRLLGIVYAVAFLVAINEIIPLIGSDGLLPAAIYLKQWSDAVGPVSGFLKLPSIFWLGHSDTALMIVSWTGLYFRALQWQVMRMPCRLVCYGFYICP